jgi:hypothetical protein
MGPDLLPPATRKEKDAEPVTGARGQRGRPGFFERRMAHVLDVRSGGSPDGSLERKNDGELVAPGR